MYRITPEDNSDHVTKNHFIDENIDFSSGIIIKWNARWKNKTKVVDFEK